MYLQKNDFDKFVNKEIGNEFEDFNDDKDQNN